MALGFWLNHSKEIFWNKFANISNVCYAFDFTTSHMKSILILDKALTIKNKWYHLIHKINSQHLHQQVLHDCAGNLFNWISMVFKFFGGFPPQKIRIVSQMKLVYENLEDTKIIIPFFPICSIFSCLSIATPHEQGVGRCVTDEA